MDLGLTGRIALVTGASRGLGAAIALGLAQEGAQVLATARSEDGLAALARDGGPAIETCAADVGDPATPERVVAEVIERYGRIDVLVNNAGIAPAGEFATQSTEVWDTVFAVNVLAPMRFAQAAGKHMIAQGSGKIINIASTTGVRGKPNLVAYSASKGAVVRMTEALAAEWARHDVQVNVIAPGAFATDAQERVTASPELLARRIRRIPAGRMAQPTEIVGLTCLLASAHADFATGATFIVDGGEAGKL